eukprot:5987908-Prymnesium_polylepis.1
MRISTRVRRPRGLSNRRRLYREVAARALAVVKVEQAPRALDRLGPARHRRRRHPRAQRRVVARASVQKVAAHRRQLRARRVQQLARAPPLPRRLQPD